MQYNRLLVFACTNKEIADIYIYIYIYIYVHGDTEILYAIQQIASLCMCKSRNCGYIYIYIYIYISG